MSFIRGSAGRESRKKSVVTNIGGKWQSLPPLNRLTCREMVKEGKRKWKGEGEAGGIWHYSITIRAVLDFPTFQNKETNFSQSLSGSHRKPNIIFPDSPGACTLCLPPFQRVLYITLSTVEFYYLSYAFLNTKKNSKKVYNYFLLHFSTHKKKKDMCGVYMYYKLYYVAILCIVVLSKHYNDNG